MNPGTGRVQRPRSRVSARSCSGMCVAGFGRARAVMKMRSGKVVPLCSINQGGKENGCERQSLETAPREAERGKWEGGKSSAENRREAGPGALPPCASSRTSSAPQTLVRSLLKSPILLPRLPTPFPQFKRSPSKLSLSEQRRSLHPVSSGARKCPRAHASCTRNCTLVTCAHNRRDLWGRTEGTEMKRAGAGSSLLFSCRASPARARPFSTQSAFPGSPLPTTAVSRPLLLFAFGRSPGECGV